MWGREGGSRPSGVAGAREELEIGGAGKLMQLIIQDTE